MHSFSSALPLSVKSNTGKGHLSTVIRLAAQTVSALVPALYSSALHAVQVLSTEALRAVNKKPGPQMVFFGVHAVSALVPALYVSALLQGVQNEAIDSVKKKPGPLGAQSWAS